MWSHPSRLKFSSSLLISKALKESMTVSYSQDWIEKYAALVSVFEFDFAIIKVRDRACGSFTVISNAFHASVQNRRDEIVVLEMIGATPSIVRKPFLIEGSRFRIEFFCYSSFCCVLMFFSWELKTFLLLSSASCN